MKQLLVTLALGVMVISCKCNSNNDEAPKKMSKNEQQSNNNMNKQTAKQSRSSDY